MPKVEITTDKMEIEVDDDYPMIDMCDDYDTSILFGCRDGACGACMIKVLEGADNLSPKKEHESDFLETMAAEDDERLACQCRVRGNVRIEVSE